MYSARYAEPGKRKATVLEKLKGVPEEKRGAHFTSAICCVFPNGDVLTAEGTCEGTILSAPRGENGFGYDPVFHPDGFDRSMAELTMEEKNAISHRGKALAQFRQKWEKYYDHQ